MKSVPLVEDFSRNIFGNCGEYLGVHKTDIDYLEVCTCKEVLNKLSVCAGSKGKLQMGILQGKIASRTLWKVK